MIEGVADDGYDGITTRRLRALAGVSERTIYDHFPSKEDYFLATYDQVVAEATGRISRAYRAASEGKGDWTSGLCGAFGAFAAELVERPAPSRLALVEILSLGPDAKERIEQAESIFVSMIRQSFDQAPDPVAVPPGLIRPLVGGVWFVARNRLLEGEAEAFAGCGAELGEWLLSHRTASPIPLMSIPRPPSPWVEAEGRSSSGAAEDRARLLRASATLIARGGFSALAESEVARLAEVAPATFAAHFEDAHDCFVATLEFLSAQALARALRESEGASTWAAAVCQAIRSLFLQIAADRAFARAAFAEPFAAGPVGMDRRRTLVQGFANVLLRRAPDGHRPTELVAEAIVGAVWSLVQRQVRKGNAQRLPTLTGHAAFLALAPIVGTETALETIASALGSSGRPAAPRRRALGSQG